MKEIGAAYNHKFAVDDDVVIAWGKYFDEFDVAFFEHAAREWVLKNQKPPTVADLIVPCRRMKSETELREKRRR